MRRHYSLKTTLILLLATALATTTCLAEGNDALLNILVKKKVLTEREADSVREELQKDEEKSSADKIKLTSSVTELKLGGDLRFRYQYDNKDPQFYVPQHIGDRTPNGDQRSRWLFRLRLNADFKLQNNFFGGVQLVTNNASDSDNQVYENGYIDYNIYISRAYLGWHANDWLTIIGGKQPNPFYSTELVWDQDINPSGLVAQIDIADLFWGRPDAVTASLSKDGKTTLTAAPEKNPWTLKLTMAAFIYDDNNEYNPDSDENTDAYQFGLQLLTGYEFKNGIKVTVAPGWMVFNAAALSGFNNQNYFSDAVVSGESRKLSVITAPGDVSFKLGGLKTKFYWDFAWNTSGRGRGDDVYYIYRYTTYWDRDQQKYRVRVNSMHAPQDDFAFLAGLQFGELGKAGEWMFRADYRQTGIDSVDPNLNESDFALGELNTRGFKIGLFYNFTSFLNAGVTYMYAWNLRDNLYEGEASFDRAIGDSNQVQVLQVDLNVKF